MIPAKNMGVIVDQVFYFDGRQFSTDETLVSFSKYFSKYFGKISFIARVVPGTGPYPLDPIYFDVVPLPYYTSLYTVCWHFPGLRRAIRSIFKDNSTSIDVYWLRGPHPISLWMADLCRTHGKPYFLMVGQNLYQQVDKKKFSLQKIAALGYITWLEKHFRDHARTCLTFTVGQDLYKRFSTGTNTVVPMISSLIAEDAILRSMKLHEAKGGRTDRTRLTIITVGRIEPEKGHIVLLDAMSLLLKQDVKVILKIVGTGSEEAAVRRYAAENGLAGQVEFAGYVPFGPQLEALYRCSDIFALPSLSEGFPRVIVEAMAHGVPVVTTRVGGIPFALADGHDALLVDPCSPRQLAEAIQQINDNGLRNKLITNGFNTALGMTAESQRDLVYNSIIARYPQLAR